MLSIDPLDVRRGWLDSLLRSNSQFALACLLCALPVMIAHYPPMVDVPQHAAMIAGVKGVVHGEWKFADMFEVNFFTPYLLGYSLIQALSYLTGVLWATKIVVALACVGMPLAAGRLMVRAGINPILRWPLLALPFGFAYDWGFLNFIVALPFGFLFLSSVLAWREARGAGRWIHVACWLHFLFFAHLLVAGFFAVIAALLLSRPWRSLADWTCAVAPLLSVVPTVLTWLLWSMGQSKQVGDPVQWLVGWDRVPSALVMMVASPAALPGIAVAFLFLLLPWMMGLRPGRSLAHWGPFAFFSIWMMLFPNYVFGNLFSYQRFGILGVPIYYLMFQSPAAARQSFVRIPVLGMACVLVSLMMIVWHGIRASVFDREASGYREVMAHAQPGGRLLYLALDRGSATASAPLFMHFAGWYQAENNGLAELSFAKFWVTPLKFRIASDSAIELGFEWHPEALDWDRERGDRYDYVLVRSRVDHTEGLRSISRCSLRLLSQVDEWWLYERSGLASCSSSSGRAGKEAAPDSLKTGY